MTVNSTTLVDGSNGGLASNYSLAAGQTAAATIAAKALTAAANAANKTYDGDATAAAILAITGGLVGTETVSATGVATFNSKDVANATLVTVNSTALVDGSNGGLASNYSLAAGQTAAATVAAKALTATANASNKTYNGDATAAAILAITGGLVGTETVSATGVATFNSKDVTNANLVTVNSTALVDGTNGGLASNYSLAAGQTAAATIATKALTATANASNKTYDGDATAAAILAITGGLVGTETVSATGVATFNSKDVANANLVTVNSTTLVDGSNGGLASNYSLATGQMAAATIAAKALTATAYASNKTYDGDTTAAAILAITGGLVGTETVSATGVATFNSKDVANANLVTVNSTTLVDGSNGGLASNYSLAAGQTAAATIAAKALTATANASNKTYDGDTTAAAILAITGGLVGTETVSATGVATFNSKDVANANLVTVNSTTLADGTNGGLASNYSLAAGQTAAATIAARALTATAYASNKTYDGNTTAATALAIAGGLVGTETVSATGGATFNSKDVANANLVTVNSTALVDGSNGGLASNYSLAAGQTAAAAIAAKALTISGMTAVNKVYDGNASAVLNSGTLDGLIDAETLAFVGQTGTFSDKNVGTAKTVAVTGAALANGTGLASNYSIANPTGLVADIARLTAVTWVGGASGSWFDAANWAGGAVPDLANVAHVVIPAGVTVTVDNGSVVFLAQAGTVNVESIGSGGSVSMVDGSLNVATSVRLASFEQSGGTIRSGTMEVGRFSQSGSSLASTGNLTVTDAYRQSGSGTSVNVDGNTGITQTSGTTVLGNITIAGTLDVAAVNGDITQLAGTSIVSKGAVRLSAPNGIVALAGSGNSLGAAIISDSNDLATGAGDASNARLQNALAGAVSMEGMNVTQDIAGASPSVSGRSLRRLPPASSAAAILAGLNVTLMDQGVRLPPEVQPDDVTEDEK